MLRHEILLDFDTRFCFIDDMQTKKQMSFSKKQLWESIVRKNPKFPNEGANFAPDGLQKFFDLVWEQAYKRGKHDKKLIHHLEDTVDIAKLKTKNFIRNALRRRPNFTSSKDKDT